MFTRREKIPLSEILWSEGLGIFLPMEAGDTAQAVVDIHRTCLQRHRVHELINPRDQVPF